MKNILMALGAALILQACTKKEEFVPPMPPAIPLHAVVNTHHFLETATDQELILKFYQVLATQNKNVILVPAALNLATGQPVPQSSSLALRQNHFQKRIKASEVNQWAGIKVFSSEKADPQMTSLQALRYNLDYSWEFPFAKAMTKNEYFSVSPSEVIQVKMMEQSGTFNFLEDDNARILELPIKGGLQLQILLPAKGKDLNYLEPKLVTDQLFPRKQLTKKENVLVKLPNTDIHSVVFFKQIFTDAGSAKRFIPPSELAQIANISFGEAGDWSISKDPNVAESNRSTSKEFICNQPFLFAVKKAEQILMIGKVLRPTED